jgi:hypothetical protein
MAAESKSKFKIRLVEHRYKAEEVMWRAIGLLIWPPRE